MRRLLSVICMASLCTSMYAFSGSGSGTEKDPYLVTNADELFEVRNELSAYYKQVCDIDLTDWIKEETPTLGWIPIGSYENPFEGYYDGGNNVICGLYTNRGNNDCVGLFGCVKDAAIKNIGIINPKITGQNDVAVCVGRFCYSNSCDKNGLIENIVVSEGVVNGVVNTSSIVGSIEPYTLKEKMFPREEGIEVSIMIKGCYSSAQIESSGQCGGICGNVVCGDYYYYSSGGYKGKFYQCYKVYIEDNTYDGVIYGNGACGILGKIQDWSASYHVGEYAVYEYLNTNMVIERNIFSGSIYANEGDAIGIALLAEGSISLKNNYSLAKELSTLKSIYRITSSSGYPTNFAYNGSITMIGGKNVVIEDDEYNGVSYGSKTLKREGTYEGTDFDFISMWSIVEGQTYPFNKLQSSPAVISKFVGGSKGYIEGLAEGIGKVYVIINDVLYESTVVEGKWKVNLGNISENEEAKVYVAINGNLPSISSNAKAIIEVIIPEVISGDANGDGAVDAVDVVSIINYILGKPSSSFNEKNADVNGDGQILIDDAVEAVNIIMNNQ